MSIVDNLNTIKDNIPSNVTLVLVSKTQPNSNILTAYNEGYRIFGENKIQELQKKEKELPSDIQWHMIGHLQTNKVKYIAPFINLIHSVDSIRLLKEINKRAKENNRIINHNALLFCIICCLKNIYNINNAVGNPVAANKNITELLLPLSVI